MMKLEDTVEMMVSEDYKERFKAEYFQLAVRVDGLKNMLNKWDKRELNFTPTCPRNVYVDQLKCMEIYMNTLEERARLEHIDLSYVEADTAVLVSKKLSKADFI